MEVAVLGDKDLRRVAIGKINEMLPRFSYAELAALVVVYEEHLARDEPAPLLRFVDAGVRA